MLAGQKGETKYSCPYKPGWYFWFKAGIDDSLEGYVCLQDQHTKGWYPKGMSQKKAALQANQKWTMSLCRSYETVLTI